MEENGMNGPKAIRKVILTGQSLSLEEFVAVARFGASVELAQMCIRDRI